MGISALRSSRRAPRTTLPSSRLCPSTTGSCNTIAPLFFCGHLLLPLIVSLRITFFFFRFCGNLSSSLPFLKMDNRPSSQRARRKQNPLQDSRGKEETTLQVGCQKYIEPANQQRVHVLTLISFLPSSFCSLFSLSSLLHFTSGSPHAQTQDTEKKKQSKSARSNQNGQSRPRNEFFFDGQAVKKVKCSLPMTRYALLSQYTPAPLYLFVVELAREKIRPRVQPEKQKQKRKSDTLSK